MTLKPPTKTLPKLVMKEWPGRDNSPSPIWSSYWTSEALSDFTRVLEEVQGKSQKEKSRDE